MDLIKPKPGALPGVERTTTKTRKFYPVMYETDLPPQGGPGSSLMPMSVDDMCEIVRQLPSPDRFRVAVALEEARQEALALEGRPVPTVNPSPTIELE